MNRAAFSRSRPPTALTIAGSDSGGGAGAQADLKTFLCCHVHGMSALTAVTVQNSRGVSDFVELPAQTVADQIESVTTDIGVDAAKTGMLASTAIIEAVSATVERLAIAPFVVDPVAASQHGDPLLRPEALDALRRLILPLATLVTPNLGEVRLLTGIEVGTRAQLADAARALHDLGPQWVLVKGGHLPDDDAVDLLYDGTAFEEFVAPRRTTDHTHGSGDTLAAAITAMLARGLAAPEAVRWGKAFIAQAVADSFALGDGLGPVGHFWRVRDWPDDKSEALWRSGQLRSSGWAPPTAPFTEVTPMPEPAEPPRATTMTTRLTNVRSGPPASPAPTDAAPSVEDIVGQVRAAPVGQRLAAMQRLGVMVQLAAHRAVLTALATELAPQLIGLSMAAAEDRVADEPGLTIRFVKNKYVANQRFGRITAFVDDGRVVRADAE